MQTCLHGLPGASQVGGWAGLQNRMPDAVGQRGWHIGQACRQGLPAATEAGGCGKQKEWGDTRLRRRVACVGRRGHGDISIGAQVWVEVGGTRIQA